MLNASQQADFLYENEKYHSALALYESSGDNSARTQWNIARCKWKVGQYQGAVTAFERAFNADSSINHAMSLANAYIMLGMTEKARGLLTRINMAQPGFANAAINLSLLQFCENRHQAAFQTIEKALQHNLSDPNVIITLYAFYKLTDPSRAAELHSRLPQDIRSQSNRSSIDFIADEIQRNREIKLTSSTLTGLSYALRCAKLEGSVIECGVFYGRSINYMASKYAGTIHGFDSFSGLPEAWKADETEGSYSTEGELPEVADNVKLHQGWFEDTLPAFAEEQKEPIRLLHIDCDIYSSTKTILDSLSPLIRSGTVIVFDEFLGYPDYQQHEFKAFYEFIENTQHEYEFISFSLLPHEAAVRIK